MCDIIKFKMSLVATSCWCVSEGMLLRRASGMFVFLGMYLTLFAPACDGGNILVFPVDGSHWINMKVLMEELHAKGHSMTVIRGSNSWYIPEKSPIYTSITIKIGERFDDFFNKFLKENIKVCLVPSSC